MGHIVGQAPRRCDVRCGVAQSVRSGKGKTGAENGCGDVPRASDDEKSVGDDVRNVIDDVKSVATGVIQVAGNLGQRLR